MRPTLSQTVTPRSKAPAGASHNTDIGKVIVAGVVLTVMFVASSRAMIGSAKNSKIKEYTLVEASPAVVRAAKLVNRICAVSNNLTGIDTIALSQAVAEAGVRYSLAPELILAVISAESKCNINARSHKGARGLMQLMPSTAAELGIKDVGHLPSNVDGGSRYLARMLGMFNGNVELAVAAYNAGPYSVKKNRGIPPFNETKRYVKKVVKSYEDLRLDTQEKPV